SVLRHCDGKATREQLRELASRDLGSEISADELSVVLGRLDQALVLDGPSFRSIHEVYAAQDVRPAALAGRSYPSDPARLRAT
ncbi:hypothetical protein NQU36_27650, partial [Escherichia coli]|uniref:hypothetical protein n=1 Tax=Escherichia coli TaxID=562 RepID=UPI00211868A5